MAGLTKPERRLNMAKICVLDGTGHTEAAVWEAGNLASCVVAQQAFERLQSEGYAAFGVNEAGETEGVLDSFDPSISEITFLRPFAGG
jgi:hypothetical protein